MKIKGCKTKVLSALLICSVVMTTGCAFLPETEENRVAPIAKTVEEQPIYYVNVIKSDLTETFEVSVDVNQVELVTLGYGRDNVKVEKVYVKSGDSVKEGDILVEADSDKIIENIALYESNITELTKEVEYYTSLVDIEEQKKLVYEKYGQTFDETLLDEYTDTLESYSQSLNVATLQYYEEQEKLNECRIYAPFDGIIKEIVSVSDEDSDLLTKWDAAAKIAREGLYVSTITKSEEYFEIGKTYTCIYSYYKNEFTGQNDYKDSTKNNQQEMELVTDSFEVECTSIECKNESTGTYELRFSLVDSSIELPGYIHKSHIVFELSSVEDVLCIPEDALITTSDGYAVYMISEDGSKRIQNVEVGIIAEGYAEIKSGLEITDQVVTDREVNIQNSAEDK